MSFIHDDILYTKKHQWIRMVDEFTGVCGITEHVQEILKDIVFLELPDVGLEFIQDEHVMSIESVTKIFEVFSPVSGRIVKVNSSLEDTPELINNDPYNEGWLFEIDVKSKIELEELMDNEEYDEYKELE